MRYIILGTAGHIDHGKSALVKALTGVDPDRLKEEKERGITVDLGFADLMYPDGPVVGIVDVPGHERLIRNMLAGAGGLDIVLMVFAADEGIMPQSREHLAICNLLRVKHGLIAVTKSDLVDEEWLLLVVEEIRDFVRGTFLEGAEIIPVSSRTGHNMDLLKEKIGEIASGVEPKSINGIFRLPVDRVFTLKGFGTVVTGTAVSGTLSLEENVEVLPSGIKSKVRGLQSHGTMLKKAYAGQRVAVNLQGIAKEDLQRGDVITSFGKLRPTYVVDAVVEILGDSPITGLKNRSLVHFHTGTSELVGRIVMFGEDELKPGMSSFCQFRFKSPLAVMAGDRFIIRRFSPLMTIGGGEILDTSPKRRRRAEGYEDLKVLAEGDLREKIRTKALNSGINGVTRAEIEGWVNAGLREIEEAAESLVSGGGLVRCGERLIEKTAFDDFAGKVVSLVGGYHKKNPLKPGMLKEELRAKFRGLNGKMFEDLILLARDVVLENEVLRLRTFTISLDRNTELLEGKIVKALEAASFQPPAKDELGSSLSITPKEIDEILRILAARGKLVRINDSLYLSAKSYDSMIDSLKRFYRGKAEMSVGEFRDLLGTTRKYALPYLEYLDSNKITLRVGDVRKLLMKENV
jgi:selenocysteine-specific elongation factor